MTSLTKHLPRITAALLLAFLAAMLARGQAETTQLLIVSSVLMFACCWASAIHLLGARPALHFVVTGVGMGAARLVDTVVRVVLPGFSIARLVTRIVGYRFAAKVLMDQTRPLKLPEALLNQVSQVTTTWQDDPKAPGWMNALERRLTGRHKYQSSRGPIQC